MKRELVYIDAHSSKFWNLELNGSAFTVTYGRIGTGGQTQTKTFANEAEARKEADKLVKEKVSKGYRDAAESGVSASGTAPTAGDQIPLLAFASINRRDEIGENTGTFIGQRVVDYDAEKPARSDVIYRFRGSWDENEIIPHLEQYFATPAAASATGLILGAWHGDDVEMTSADVIDTLTRHRAALPRLAAIYVGDITSEENEMSWIKQSDLSPLLEAFPRLQLLRSRGGDGLALTNPEHESLRGLALETGGMDVEVIRSICTAHFPKLEHLELWLGTEEYGANHNLADLQPIFSGELFPELKYLGLRNSQIADEIAGVIVNSPVIHRLETLDLSLGVLTDDGARSLLKLPASSTLKRLNLHYNYISADLIRQLKQLPLTVDASKPGNMEEDDEWRFVAVGE